MARVVVPVDFTARSANALLKAQEIAGDAARIAVVHVLPNYDAFAYERDDAHRLESAAMALKRWIDDLGIAVGSCEVRPGDPAPGIVAFCDDVDADLIVMPAGKHGLLGMGSVSKKVVRLSTRPVLVLRGDAWESPVVTLPPATA